MKVQTKNTTFLLLLMIALVWTGLALAKGPSIRVNEAIPSEAVQGQQDYKVKIRGKGFGHGATVRFLVADSEDDDQIVVEEGSVVYDDETGDLDMVIDVKSGATISYYDIEVLMSGRRGGKGTDLFRVQSQTSGNDNLTAKFCLTMDPLNPGFSSDGKEYCDSKKDHVGVATGAGPGFRFDSNLTNKAPKRTVSVNFPGDEVRVYDDGGQYLSTLFTMDYEIDLRFNQKNGGLDLGSLENPGDVGFVPIDIDLRSLDGIDHIGMSYSVDTVPFSHGYLTGQTCTVNNTLMARVERISTTEWTIESNPLNSNTCLWDMNSDLLSQQEGTVVQMPFRFTIKIK